jgi:hypothetical protein
MAAIERSASAATPRYSSSPELSTPPRSPSDAGSPSARQILNDHREAQHIIVNHYGVDTCKHPNLNFSINSYYLCFNCRMFFLKRIKLILSSNPARSASEKKAGS